MLDFIGGKEQVGSGRLRGRRKVTARLREHKRAARARTDEEERSQGVLGRGLLRERDGPGEERGRKRKESCGPFSYFFPSLLFFLFPKGFSEKESLRKLNKIRPKLFLPKIIYYQNIFCKLIYLLDKKKKLVLIV